MSNPIEHPAESAVSYDGPRNTFQAVVDRHLDEIDTELTAAGVHARSILIGVRLDKPFDEADNDCISGYRLDVEEDEDLGKLIVDHLRRMTRSVLRTMMGMKA